MADPLTIGLIVSAAGTVTQAIGGIAAGNAKADAEKYNAAQAEANAKIVQEQTAQEEQKVRIMGRRALGSIRAAYGASGVTMEGSPLDVLAMSAANAEQDALNVRKAGEQKANMLYEDARMGRKSAEFAQTSGYMAAAGALLQGTGNTMGILKRSG